MRSFLAGVSFELDASDLESKVNYAYNVLSEKNFRRVMLRTFNEVGKRGKKIIGDDSEEYYHGGKHWIYSGIKSAQIGFGGGADVTCKIPLKSVKGSIGGTFGAGMSKGWVKVKMPNARASAKGRVNAKGRVTAHIVKGGTSILPAKLPNQGGNPPFMMNGLAMTRRTDKRYPIVKVKGLAIPQMPLNRASDDVQNDLLALAGKRLEHNLWNMFGL